MCLAQVVEQRAVSQELCHDVDGLLRRALHRALRAHAQQAHQVLVLLLIPDGRLFDERARQHPALQTQLLHRHVHRRRALLAVTLRAAQLPPMPVPNLNAQCSKHELMNKTRSEHYLLAGGGVVGGERAVARGAPFGEVHVAEQSAADLAHDLELRARDLPLVARGQRLRTRTPQRAAQQAFTFTAGA